MSPYPTANLAGYAFARLHFKGRELMFGLVLFQMMIPAQIFIIPQYVMVSKLHLETVYRRYRDLRGKIVNINGYGKTGEKNLARQMIHWQCRVLLF